MGAKRSRPDDDTLEEWFEAGWTYQQMADFWAEHPEGKRLTPAAFRNHCMTQPWFKPRNARHIGTALMPWTNIRPEHADLYEVQMLRRESLRRAGHKFPRHDYEIQRLNAWLQGLRDENAVIAYERDTQQGWWRVTRKHSDVDIVRLP